VADEPTQGASMCELCSFGCTNFRSKASSAGGAFQSFWAKLRRVRIDALLVLILLLAALVIVMIFALIFNIAIFHSALSHAGFPLPDLTVLRQALERVLGPLGWLAAEFVWLLDALDFLRSFGWCGGVLVLLVPYAMIMAVIAFRILLGRDVLLQFGISIQRHGIGAPWYKKLMLKGSGKVLQLMVLFFVQLCVDLLTRLVVSAFQASDSCSAIDRLAVVVGRFFIVIIMVGFLVVNWTLFTGTPTGRSKALIVDYLYGVPRLVLMSLGVWTNDTVEAYHVRARAAAFDQNEEDSDDQQEEVVYMTGRSRGLVWIAFPYGIIAAKLSDAVNSPPLFNLTTRIKDPVTNTYVFDGQRALHLHSSLWVRLALWVGNSLQFAFILIFVVFGDEWALAISVASLLPNVLANFVTGTLEIVKSL
jgi:hypothetical protein